MSFGSLLRCAHSFWRSLGRVDNHGSTGGGADTKGISSAAPLGLPSLLYNLVEQKYPTSYEDSPSRPSHNDVQGTKIETGHRMLSWSRLSQREASIVTQ
ncbi:uncharacterized protein EAF02_007604 [Botrytis sinoallii]|uniref:uncharacterized protein n=1 Tax=Botrytis sinoallii TaxID=1463999 RepID=UPI00190238EE|nr:uncharacterized protein EAF02_007604 [Botrytis sinoallii]KAF7879967.1 hypothetical protein EAF02_007604 [Botrytis sinoallii]